MGRKVDSRRIRREIELAFVNASYPGDDQLVYDASYPDVAETRDAFKGRDWRDLDVSFLRRNAEALSFLTPEGLRYYLPAFMIASMLEPKRADAIPLFVCLSLTPPQTGESDLADFKRRMAIFDSAERSAIRAFLSYAREHLGADEAKHALHRYWEQAAKPTGR
jgi:hypothetical protein